MDLISIPFYNFFVNFFRTSERCSAESHTLIYLIMGSSLLITCIGVYVWLRFIRTQPGVKVGAQKDTAYVGTHV
jgi:hypothetical protein